MGIPDIVSLIKDISSIISGIILTVIAIMGLQTWKRQLKGNTEYELARRFLGAVYKIRDAISYTRNPFVLGGEIASALQEANIEIDKSDSEYQVKSQNALYQKRWKKMQEALSEFNLVIFEIEVLWGKEIRETIKPLGNCIADLHFEIQRMLRKLDQDIPEDLTDTEDRRRNDIIYSFDNLVSDDTDNHFSKKIINAISNIEKYVKPRIKL